MITRTCAMARWVAFAAANWIMVLMFWGLISGTKHMAIPQLAVWIFIGAKATQLCLRLASKVVRVG